ncbi:hypothetical protein [Microbulbifer epialgicus]|uniref:Uncharacterized protein n=1 Tax=Microbulbifer epialgicus TaxID=393907 RepID=A0ABV4P2B3_9GAMM
MFSLFLGFRNSIASFFIVRFFIYVAVLFWCSQAHALLYLRGPSENFTGTFTLTWSSGYTNYVLQEYKNGVLQRDWELNNKTSLLLREGAPASGNIKSVAMVAVAVVVARFHWL